MWCCRSSSREGEVVHVNYANGGRSGGANGSHSRSRPPQPRRRSSRPGELTEPHDFEPTKRRLTTMVIVGDVTPTSVKLWAKVPSGGAWTMAISKHSFRNGPAGTDLANMSNMSVNDYLTSTLGGGEGEGEVHGEGEGEGEGGKRERQREREEGERDEDDKEEGEYEVQMVILRDEGVNGHGTGLLTHTFVFTDLRPDTRYYYLLAAEADTDAGEGWKRGVIGGDAQDEFFTTAKLSYESVKMVAYSCHDPFSWKAGEAVEGLWPFMASMRDEFDLSMGGGDQIYVDSNEVAMTDLWTFLRENKGALREKFITKSHPQDGGYEDGQVGRLDEDGMRDYLARLIRQYYLIYWNFQGLIDVHRRVPAYMIWDDHEIMDGWGSLNRKERVEKLKKKEKSSANFDDELVLKMVDLTWRAAAQVYDEYQHCHNPGPNFTEPVTGIEKCDPKDFVWDFGFERGPEYKFYVTDMRGAHDCDNDKDRLFGTAQHRRLRKWLDSFDDRVKAAFITIPVPVVHWSGIVEYSQYVVKSLKDDLMDGWGHVTNHNERGRLLKACFEASNRTGVPIVLISGDVHCCSVYIITDRDNYPKGKIIQITSSAISRKPCPGAATIAFAGTGLMTRRKDDGKGKEVKTSIYCEQRFAKSGVTNFCVVGAKGSEITVKFYWSASKGGSCNVVKSANVDVS